MRAISQRLESLTDQISRMEPPKKFRLADAANLAAIAIAIVVALITAFGANERINDVGHDQTASEARVSAQITTTETRLGAKMDKLDDRFTQLDERTANLEGARSQKR